MGGILWAVIVVLFVLWLVGLVMAIGGPLIHILLVVAAVLLAYNLLTKGRATL